MNVISFVSCRAQRPKESRAVSKFSESASVRGKDGKLVVLAQVPLSLIVDAPIDCKNLRVEFVKETSGMSGFVVLAIKQVAIDSGK